MNSLYFVLGSFPKLSIFEITCFYKGATITPISSHLVRVDQSAPFAQENQVDKLGGVVKILQPVEGKSQPLNLDSGEIISKMVEVISAQKPKLFSITNYGLDQVDLDSMMVKRSLSKKGFKSRYMDGGKFGLSAAVLTHQDACELSLLIDQDKPVLLKTIQTQNIDDWTKRDRSKPYFDRKKGMLSPKLARMMVNFALDKNPTTTPTLYDPFCGTGTILIEGLLSGANVIGSDNDSNAVAGSKSNLEWFDLNYPHQNEWSVFKEDVASAKVPNLVDCIVTEPFLGRPTPQKHQLANIFKGLAKLYLGAFQQWTRILKPGGKVVIVFPLVEHESERFSLESLIDKLENKGYTLQVNSLTYQRPRAIVARQIMIFEWSGNK